MLSTFIPIHLVSHYCGGELVAQKLLFSGHGLNCGMVDDESCDETDTIKKNCCSSKFIAFDNLQNANRVCTSLDIEQNAYLLNSNLVLPKGGFYKRVSSGAWNYYHPPPENTDFRIAYQVFII